MQIPISRLAHFPAIDLPRYQTAGSSGLDLLAAIAEPLMIAPLQRVSLPTGIALAIPQGFEGQVRPRSGLALKHGLSMVNTPGTIDADYRGEIKVILINLGQEALRIAPGDRIAQLVIAPVIQAELMEVASLPETGRGAGGFGSTGQ